MTAKKDFRSLISVMRHMVRCFVASLTMITSVASVRAANQKSLDWAAQVEIRRTAYGVPHILAPTESAAAFGFGYAQAEDHAQSIMRLVLAARGELAKNFGGKENVESDFEARRYRVYARAVETYHKLDPEFREILEAFAAGFSYYVELHKSELPEWAFTITPHDAAAHGMMGVMRFAFDRGGIVKEFLKRQREKEVSRGNNPNVYEEIVDTAEEFSNFEVGSNMWAFAPERTKSGKTILMGNPHQPWNEVATYYEGHVTVPGKINFYGSTFVGRPILTTGFNENLGWTHTVNYPDLEEIYELDLDPKDEDRYLFDSDSNPITREDVGIETKMEGGPITLRRTFEHTPLGPVIHRNDKSIYVLRSACYDEYRAYQQWYQMSKAKNLNEFRAAVETLAVPMFNICYADRVGNIHYLWNGMVPMLPHPAHTAEAVHATRSSEIWTKFHSVSDLPQLTNPKGGYVQNCNDPPYHTNLNEILDWNKYPAYFGTPRLGLRTQNSLEVVDNDKWFSLEDVRDKKFTLKMLLADRVKNALLAALTESNPDEETKQAIELLSKWDNTVAAESRGSVLFEMWWDIYAGPYPFKSDAFEVAWEPDDPMGTPRGIGNKPRAIEAFKTAMAETKKHFGAVEVAWGEVHRLRKGTVDLPVGGGSGFIGCFRVLGFKKQQDGKRAITGGDSWIFTVEFGKIPRAYSVVGYSQSENPNSPHYADQAPLFANNTMKPVAFTEADIKASLIKTYHPGGE